MYLTKLIKNFLAPKKIKIAIIVTSEISYCNVISIYNNFNKGKKFTTSVIPTPLNHQTTGFRTTAKAIRNNLYKKGIHNFTDINDKESLEKINIFFTFNPYNELLEPEFVHFLKTKKLCYIPYGALVNYVHYYNKFYDNCWKIFLDNDYVKNNFEHKRTKFWSDKKCMVVGLPKLDAYRNLKLTTSGYWPRKRDHEIKRLIITDHWSHIWSDIDTMATDKSGYMKFNLYKELIADLPQKYPQLDIIFRPHPLLFNNLTKNNLMTEIEIEKFLKTFTAYSNTLYDDGSIEYDYIIPFKESDALISSGVSALFEYLPSEKPILYLTKNDGDDFNLYGQKLIRHHYQANNTQDIINFIEQVVIAGDDYLKKSRLNNMRQYMLLPKRGVGKLIKKHIQKELLS